MSLREKKFSGAFSRFGMLLAVMLLSASPIGAAQSYDPYADRVEDSNTLVLNENNAVGAKNGTTASVGGVGATLTLDMGKGEEGLETLRIYLGAISATVNIKVSFLDANKGVIKSETRQLTGPTSGASSQTFSYNWRSYIKAYRFVRISTEAGAGVNVDAVRANGYLGATSTQDTDGDDRTDRAEQAAGTNPLVPNPKSITPPPGGGGGGGGGGNDGDEDNDGIDDDFEEDNGLDPKKDDSKEDPDGDGLTNKEEADLNSNPQSPDSDGDGMPDKWEVDNGTDVNRDDANEDPDGDYLTNLGEYKNGTNPKVADDLVKVFCKTVAGAAASAVQGMNWLWLLIAFILGAFVGWLATRNKETHSVPKGPVA